MFWDTFTLHCGEPGQVGDAGEEPAVPEAAAIGLTLEPVRATELLGTGGDCEFTPGASFDVLSVTAIGGKLFISTVDSLLALGGAGTRRYVPSRFFFNKNFSLALVVSRRSATCTREIRQANVEFIAGRIGHVTSSGVHSSYKFILIFDLKISPPVHEVT